MSLRNGENSASTSSSPTSSMATSIAAAAAADSGMPPATAASLTTTSGNPADMWSNNSNNGNGAWSSGHQPSSAASDPTSSHHIADANSDAVASSASVSGGDASLESAAATAAAAAAWSLGGGFSETSNVWSGGVVASSSSSSGAVAVASGVPTSAIWGATAATSSSASSSAVWSAKPPPLAVSSVNATAGLSSTTPTVDGAWGGGWDQQKPAGGPGSAAGSIAHSQSAASLHQAAGAGVGQAAAPAPPPAPLTKEQEMIESIVNSNEGWGSKPVNQTTPWEIGDSPRKPTQESLVWNHEPNNGTSIWESFYENRGERPGKWDRGQMDPNHWTSSGSSWGGGGGGGGWGAGDMGVPPPQPPPMQQPQQIAGAEPWRRPSSSSGGPGSISDWSAPVTPGTPGAGGGGDDSWKWDWRGQPPPHSGGVRGPGGGPMGGGGSHKPEMRANLIRHLMEMGFNREDATAALISCNMNIDLALNELRARVKSGAAPQQMPPPPLQPPPLGHPMQQQHPPPPLGLGHHHQAGPPPTMSQQQQQQPPPRPIFPSGGSGPPQPMRSGVPQPAVGGGAASNPARDLMRDQIIQQLRLAVQNRIISPNTLMPNQNMSQADLKLVHQLIFHQNQLHALSAQQQKIVASMRPTPGGPFSGGGGGVQSQQAAAQLQEVNQKILVLKTTIQQLSQQLQARTGQSQSSAGPQGLPPTHQPPPMQQQQPQQQQLVDQLKSLDMTDSIGGRSRYDTWNRSPDIPDAGSVFGGVGKPPMHSSISNPSLQQQQQQQQQYQSFQRSYSEMPAVGGGGGGGLISGEVMDKIPEFVPGQPWAGGYKDGLFSVTHETLEQHLNSTSDSANSRAVNRPAGVSVAPGSRWQQQPPQQASNQPRCLLIRQLNPQINREVLSMICNQQGRVLAVEVGPNNQLAMVKFASHVEADKAHKNISSLAQHIALVSDAEADASFAAAAPAVQQPSAMAPVGGWPSGGWGDQGVEPM